jgi:hypothetical protein
MFVLENVPPEDGVGKWDKNGFFIYYMKDYGRSGNPLILVYNRTGQRVSRFAPLDSLPDVQRMNLVGVAITSGRTILAGGILVKENEKEKLMASALLEYNMKGTLKRMIKTDPFAMRMLDVDGDDNIWMLGHNWQESHENFNWALIQKLSPEGVLLRSTLSRSLFPKELEPLDITSPGIDPSGLAFRVVGEKVYAWLPGVNQLAVLDLNGLVLQLVRDPFSGMFHENVKSITIFSSLGFLPQGGLVTKARGDREGEPPLYGWFFSPDLGKNWSSIVVEPDPLAARLVGFTQQGEAVLVRSVEPQRVEFCPVGY